MKILIAGLGALGTVFACLLQKQGHQVAGLDRKPVVEVVNNQGVRVTGIWGEHACHLDQAVSDVEQLQGGDFDLVIVTVKSFDTREVAAQTGKVLGAKTCVILAQNGYGNYEAAAEHIAPEKLLLGRVIFGAETVKPGVSRVTVCADDVILGSPGNLTGYKKVEEIAEILTEAGIPTRASNRVMKFVWGKIIYNSALNSLGAVLEVNYGKLAEMEPSRELMNSIVREIFAVLRAMQEETLWPDAEAYLKDFYEKLVPVTAAHHASMLQDIQRGRRTEIDFLNGAVADLGRRYGVATPVNEAITKLVKAKEKLALQIEPQSLEP